MRIWKNRKQRNKFRWGSSMLVTGVMIILIVAVSFAVINYINQKEEEKSIDRLYEEADSLADTIEMYAKSDEETLKTLATVVATYDDMHSEKLWKLLDSCSDVGMVTKIELLLPDNTVLGKGGERLETEEEVSFEEEAKKGSYITDRETDTEDSEKYIVRQCVPVYRDSQVVAILRGVADISNLAEKMNLHPYGGKAALYIIDGDSGDFLMDTWHSGKDRNIRNLKGRDPASGYESDQVKQGILNGDSGYAVFTSKTIGGYLYFYYQPMEINEWRIALSVPESVVFEGSDGIRKVLNFFMLFEAICFIGYFLWMLRFVRKTTEDKQRQLETLNDMYDVERKLFNAHHKQQNITEALHKAGNIILAERVTLWAFVPSGGHISFYWEKEGISEENTEKSASVAKRDEEQYIHIMAQYFKQNHKEMVLFSRSAVEKIFGENISPKIHSLMAVPLKDTDGKICGIMAGFNVKDKDAITLMKTMKFSFGMFCHNLSSFNAIRKQRDRDVLTGLYNRNRYEWDLSKLYSEYREALTCIYIDVNGLHEKNNTEGHEQGDIMLQTVAQEIVKQFGGEYIYRIGGDEFVVFKPGADMAEMEVLEEKLSAVLSEKDYHISVGIQCETDVVSMSELVKAAEKKMYIKKMQYYEQKSCDRRKTAVTAE